MRGLIILVAELIAVASCDGQARGAAPIASAQGPWQTVRTRSGDTSVISTIGAASALADLTLQKSLSIGMTVGPPEQMLGGVTTANAGRDGSLIFYDGMNRDIRWFDSTGRFVRTVSRVGTGPGEIPPRPPLIAQPGIVIEERTIVKIARDRTGRIVAWNSSDRLVNVYNPRGEFERAWPFPPLRNSNFKTLALTADSLVHTGGRLDSASGACTGERGARPCTDIAIRVTLTGKVVDSLLPPRLESTVPTIAYRVPYQARAGFSDSEARIPLAPYPFLAYSDLGYWISAFPDRYSLTLHRLSGGPLRITSDLPSIPIAADERRNALDRLVKTLSVDKAVRAPSLNVIPTVKPRFRAVSTDTDGRIWVLLHTPAVKEVYDVPARTSPPTPATRREFWAEYGAYDIFAPTGEFLGRVRLPELGVFFGAAGRHMWTRQQDSLGVQRLVRYSISAPAASPAAAYWSRR